MCYKGGISFCQDLCSQTESIHLPYALGKQSVNIRYMNPIVRTQNEQNITTGIG